MNKSSVFTGLNDGIVSLEEAFCGSVSTSLFFSANWRPPVNGASCKS